MMNRNFIFHSNSGQSLVGALLSVAMVGGIILSMNQFGFFMSSQQKRLNFLNLANYQAKSIRLALAQPNVCANNFSGQTVSTTTPMPINNIQMFNASNTPGAMLFDKGRTGGGVVDHDISLTIINEQPGNNFIGEIAMDFKPEVQVGHEQTQRRSVFLEISADASNQLTACRAIGSQAGSQHVLSLGQCPAGQLISGFDVNQNPICYTPQPPAPTTSPTTPPPTGGPVDCTGGFQHGTFCYKADVHTTKNCVNYECQGGGTIYTHTCDPDRYETYKCFNGQILMVVSKGSWCTNSATLAPLSQNTCPF